jgi:glycosyltransferase involved in cell wall biosynthesis
MTTERHLRIGFLTTEYPTEGYTGGIGSYVRQMTQSLASLGHSTCVLLAGGSDDGPSHDGIVPIFRVRANGPFAKLPEPIGRGASIAFAQALASVARRLDLDLLEAPEWGGLTAFLNLTKPPKLRIVVRLHTCSSIVRRFNELIPGSRREKLEWIKQDWLERRSILNADAVTAVSKSIGEETRRSLGLSRNDFQVVPNSINDSAFPTIQETGESANPIILFIGRLEWRKGPDLLIRAVPAVVQQHSNALFRFAGADTSSCPEGNSMKSYLASLLPDHLKSRVEFCGHLTHSQVDEALREATICVFPSRYEGLPMVGLEAMAHGKAIVTTDIPGFCELISNGETGLIVSEEDPEMLASAIGKLVSDDQLRAKLGDAAQSVARLQFHGSVVANSMLQIYRRLVDSD